MVPRKHSHVSVRVIFLWVSVAAWMTLIFLLSHESAEGSSERSGVLVGILLNLGVGDSLDIPETVIRKTAHVMMYAVLGALLFAALRASGATVWRAARGALVVAVLYAVTDEIHQLYIPGRSGEVGDVLIDSIGAGIGICGALIAKRSAKKDEP